MSTSIEQEFAIIQEVDTSIKLIQTGLGAVQKLGGGNDFYHLPILLLANGLERLMKSIICLHKLETEGNFKKAQEQWRGGAQGHDLNVLCDYIIDACFSSEYLELSAARQDHNYITSNELVSKVLKMLSEFGKDSRYFNLNVVLGRKNSYRSPDTLWSELEMDIFHQESDYESLLTDPRRTNELHQRINKRIVVCVERIVRAFLRLFTLGGLGDAAKRQTGIIQSFLCLRDDELGNKTYNLFDCGS